MFYIIQMNNITKLQCSGKNRDPFHIFLLNFIPFLKLTLSLTSSRNPNQALVVSLPAVANVLHWGAPTTMTAV